MVNYNLGIYREENKNLDLSKLTDSIEVKKIQFIDKFTSQFESEEELKIYLLNKGLIEKSDINDPLRILYQFKGRVQNLPIVYKCYYKYLEPSYISYKIRYLSSSIKFLNELANHYDYGSDKINPQSANVLDIRCYINELKNGYSISTTILDIALNDLCKKAMYKKDKKNDKSKLNYRGLRDLGLFIYRFEKLDFLTSSKNSVQENKQETKKIILGDQMNLFDDKYISNIQKNKNIN